MEIPEQQYKVIVKSPWAVVKEFGETKQPRASKGIERPLQEGKDVNFDCTKQEFQVQSRDETCSAGQTAQCSDQV